MALPGMIAGPRLPPLSSASRERRSRSDIRASPWHVWQRVWRIETAVASGDCARTAQANTNPTHTDRMVHFNILHSERRGDASSTSPLPR
jgi:hypothetical protein